MLSRRFVLASMLVLTAFGGEFAGPAMAKQGGLTPAKVKQIKKVRKSFENCRKEALEQLKLGAVSRKKFEVALNTCKENFPGASLYITCKKQAIKSSENKNIPADQAIEQCKRYLLAATFDPDEPVPFFVEAGQVYFAGLGLNRTLPAAALNPPNFTCEKLQSVVRNPEGAQYILFGNHPRAFAGLAEKKGPDLLKVLKITKPSPKGVEVTGLGKVFGDPKTAQSVVFFPSASCDLESDPGSIFSGMSAYYLLDSAGSSVTPYFGIAYYKAEQTKVTTAKLLQSLVHLLGTNFKTYTKNNVVTFVAASNVSETDDEQDPKNLCRQPRAHRFVGVVQGQKDDAKKPEYLILANVKALCDFGDRLGKRFVE